MNRIVVLLVAILALGLLAGTVLGWKALGWRSRLADLKEHNRDYAGIETYAGRSGGAGASGAGPDIVFIGASHTLDWGDIGARFPDLRVENRGIGGQLVPQYLLRFRQDVLDLKPKVVVIEGCAINVTYAVPLRTLVDSYASMVELARLHGIEPILATVMPVGAALEDRIPGLNAGVRRVNEAIQATAASLGVRVVDYHAAVADPQGMLPEGESSDGMHCAAGVYDRMAEALEPVLRETLAASGAAL